MFVPPQLDAELERVLDSALAQAQATVAACALLEVRCSPFGQ